MVELTLEELKDLARSHWKEHRPRLYRNLEKSGKLEKSVEDAAHSTLEAFNLKKGYLERAGLGLNLASEIAWNLVKNEWPLVRRR